MMISTRHPIMLLSEIIQELNATNERVAILKIGVRQLVDAVNAGQIEKAKVIAEKFEIIKLINEITPESE